MSVLCSRMLYSTDQPICQQDSKTARTWTHRATWRRRQGKGWLLWRCGRAVQARVSGHQAWQRWWSGLLVGQAHGCHLLVLLRLLERVLQLQHVLLLLSLLRLLLQRSSPRGPYRAALNSHEQGMLGALGQPSRWVLSIGYGSREMMSAMQVLLLGNAMH